MGGEGFFVRRLIGLAAASCLAIPPAPVWAAPGDVNAHSFYAEARNLMGKGMAAMFDRRTRPMLAQMKDAGESVKAENEAGKARGAPLYCVPEAARKKGVDPKFIVDRLGAMPESRRRTLSLQQAWREILIREYPLPLAERSQHQQAKCKQAKRDGCEDRQHQRSPSR